MLRALLVLLVLTLIPSCGSPARPPFTISIVTPSGSDPFEEADISAADVTIRVRQLDMPILTAEGRVSGGVLAPIDLPIPSYGNITRIEIVIEEDDSGTPMEPEWIGATAPFIPFYAGSVRLVVGRPSSCAQLSAPVLGSARVGPNLVAIESNLIAIGGDEDDADNSPSNDIEQFLPVHLTVGAALPETRMLERGISAGGAVRLGETQIVALADVRLAVLYSFGTEADVDLAPHAGAGPRSALVDLGEQGAAIVGGGEPSVPSDRITWVDLMGRTTQSQLANPRTRPAAVRMGNHLLVAGGQSPGAPLFELVSLTNRARENILEFGEGLEPRFAPVLVRDSGSSRAWLGFGEDAEGNLLDTTFRIDGCPTACMATPAAPIDRPRSGVRAVERAAETVILGGAGAAGPSRFVDRVRFVDGSPVVDALGPLDIARDRPGAAEIGNGILIVAGGEGGSPLHGLRDMEICFPEALEGL